MLPYFGKFPEWFDAWKISALNNSSIDFLIYTDSDNIVSQGNLKVIRTSFVNFKAKLQSIFDFTIKCDIPYKLCDYKPCYGKALHDDLKDYDFWGHCDADMIFGNIRKYISDDILDNIEKVFTNGFLTIYRNNEKMNNLFLDDGVYPEFNYKEVYSTNHPCYFDEYSGMGLKCIRKKIKVFENKWFLDLSVSDNSFHHAGKQIICLFDKGRLYEVDENGIKNEVIFVHIQKREMKIFGVLGNKFVITPGRIFAVDCDFDKAWFDINQGRNYKYKYWIKRTVKIIKDKSVIWRIKKYIRVRKQFKYLRTLR